MNPSETIVNKNQKFGFELFTWVRPDDKGGDERVYCVKDDNGAIILNRWSMLQLISSFLLDNNLRVTRGQI